MFIILHVIDNFGELYVPNRDLIDVFFYRGGHK